ncbi:hypothetical protein [Weissella cibaria]|nr:hypothetical protein [Weissella cibaria]
MAVTLMDDDIDIFAQAARFFAHDYHERGMVKWQGYYLSDHTEDVHKNQLAAAQAATRQRMPEMDLAAITALLFDAYGRHEIVHVQQNFSATDGVVPEIITGLVTGYTESAVIIGNANIPIDQLWWASK